MRLIRAFGCAFRGIFLTIKSERNFQIDLAALVVAIALGIYLRLPVTGWGLIIFAIGFVLSSELFNTAIERLSDEVSDGERKELIRNAKDISAGAVIVAALTALVIGILVLFIPLVERLTG